MQDYAAFVLFLLLCNFRACSHYQVLFLSSQIVMRNRLAGFLANVSQLLGLLCNTPHTTRRHILVGRCRLPLMKTRFLVDRFTAHRETFMAISLPLK